MNRGAPRPPARRARWGVLVAATLPLLVGPAPSWGQSWGPSEWRFVDVTAEANLSYTHGYAAPFPAELLAAQVQQVAGGVAAGDFDRDGWLDLYVATGDVGPPLLLRNREGVRFEDVTAAAGAAPPAPFTSSGPLFFDYDGDGWLDLFVGALEPSAPRLLRNLGDGTFNDVTAAAGLSAVGGTLSASAGDSDGDGWLDLFLTRWGAEAARCHLWRNDAGRRFDCVDASSGFAALSDNVPDTSFTANFVDIDADADPDVLLAADYGTSQVWQNRGGGHFVDVTGAAITDENGMGGAIGDYDGDGDLDWFVSSIWDGDGTAGDWGLSGNRLYQNQGRGRFADVTVAAGVGEGFWGWAASFADLDNDGRLDLVHVNGWPLSEPFFRDTPTRLFMATAGGAFAERSAELGLLDSGNGRGVVCFDYDRDGDLDLFVANTGQPPRLWRNDGAAAAGSWLDVALAAPAPNSQAIGARLTLRAGGVAQLRELRAGLNYVSQDPPEAHFGLGDAARVETLDIDWPDGARTHLEDLEVNQRLTVHAPAPGRLLGGGCAGS